MEFTKNIVEDKWEERSNDPATEFARDHADFLAGQIAAEAQIQKVGSMKLASATKRVNSRPEGISLTPAEFKKAKAKKIEALIHKEEKRKQNE